MPATRGCRHMHHPAEAAEGNLFRRQLQRMRRNTGTVSLFATGAIAVDAGSNDMYLDQLGLGGGNISSDDAAGDGQLTFRASDNSISGVLQGLAYAGELQTDGGGFDLWLYNEDGSLAWPDAVTVDLTRAYTLQDVADAINISLANTTGSPPGSRPRSGTTGWFLPRTASISSPLGVTTPIFLPVRS
jgi:hypothetical protein